MAKEKNKKEQIKGFIREFGENQIVPTFKKLGFPLSISVKEHKTNGFKITTSGDCDLDKICDALDAPAKLKDLVARFYLERLGRGSNAEVLISYDSIRQLQEDEAELVSEYFIKVDSLYENTIRTLHEELNHYLTSKTLNEINLDNLDNLIPIKVRKNYKIHGKLDNVKNWEAKVIVGNSIGKDGPKIGEWSTVGYTLVSLDTGTLIPVAREDEHNTGYDLSSYLIRRKLIKRENYYPIYFANNYVYSDDPRDVSEALMAFKIWRRLGGENTLVTGTHSLSFSVTMDDYIKLKGKIKNSKNLKGELLPIGSRFIQGLEKIAQGLNAARENKRVKESGLFEVAHQLLKEMENSFYGDISKVAEQGLKALDQALANNDLKKLEEIIFHHDGIKNIVHIKIKNCLDDDGDFSFKDLSEVFGDLEKANAELIRLAQDY
jgi:hypothetical protein